MVSTTVCRFGSTRKTTPRSSSATQRLPAPRASAVVDGPTAAALPAGTPVRASSLETVWPSLFAIQTVARPSAIADGVP
jgi:hypothetical protein